MSPSPATTPCFHASRICSLHGGNIGNICDSFESVNLLIRKSFLDMYHSHLHFSLMMDLVLLMAASFLFRDSALFAGRRDAQLIVELLFFHYGECLSPSLFIDGETFYLGGTYLPFHARVAIFYVHFGVALSGAMYFCH